MTRDAEPNARHPPVNAMARAEEVPRSGEKPGSRLGSDGKSRKRGRLRSGSLAAALSRCSREFRMGRKCSEPVNESRRSGLANRGLIIYNRAGFGSQKAMAIESAKPRIVIGSDHAGFSVKETIRTYLERAGYAVSDLRTSSEQSVDYPDYGQAVGRRVVSKQADFGIA